MKMIRETNAEGVTIDMIDAPEFRASFAPRADGLTVAELQPSDLSDDERRVYAATGRQPLTGFAGGAA